MPVIRLQTVIEAGIETCFDLARSIDLHIISTSGSNEKAIDGKVSGLIGPGEFVTWQARHFGLSQKLSSRITQYSYPFHFRDEQIKGPFHHLVHDHYFSERDGSVQMTDVFDFASPLGILGKLADLLFLERYMKKLLQTRNAVLKKYAEGDERHALLRTPG